MKDRRMYNVAEAVRTYGIPERHIRYLIAKRLIDTVRIGRRVYIPEAALDALVTEGFRAGDSA